MDVPEIRYAKSGDLRIAYQVVGSSDLDLVFIQGFVSNLDLCWEQPGWAYFLSRLAGFSRFKRGGATGRRGRRALATVLRRAAARPHAAEIFSWKHFEYFCFLRARH